MSATETQEQMTNGEAVTLKSLDHLASYPIISDSITTFKGYPLGQRSINITHSAYSTFIAPFSSYLSKAAPLVNRADDLAESSLGKLEERFPIVKEPTENIKNSVVGYPKKLAGEAYARGLELANDTKEYVCTVYGEELNRQGSGEKGYIPMAKAGVTTGLVVSSDLMSYIASYLGKKSKKANGKLEEIKNDAKRNN
ncbi:uncharacterized protein H6S33_004376 [Morchella sextelata]|uniref:uncharacterized protein n=1 Tax=Morchella sextelata TaxID=1174677 RepID=UPI001D055342|nr:uncharacterized protein H6S33_004376 [Morchella sextelata]KAH0605919.1 hypothetical protein H6S33_004376 [Morchella sextelata]